MTNKKPNNTMRKKKPSNAVRIKRKLMEVLKKLKKHKNNYNGKFYSGKGCVFGSKVSWYWDIRLWSPLIIIALIITSNTNDQNLDYAMEQNTVVEATIVTTEETIPEPTLSQEESDIIALAILADTVGNGRTDEVKEIIMWVAINRTEDGANGYGKSLQEEISRPKQWQQYNPDGMYLTSTYDLATRVYNTWKSNGARPIYNDMLWFTLNGDGSITIRNRFGNEKNRSEATFGQ